MIKVTDWLTVARKLCACGPLEWPNKLNTATHSNCWLMINVRNSNATRWHPFSHLLNVKNLWTTNNWNDIGKSSKKANSNSKWVIFLNGLHSVHRFYFVEPIMLAKHIHRILFSERIFFFIAPLGLFFVFIMIAVVFRCVYLWKCVFGSNPFRFSLDHNNYFGLGMKWAHWEW